MTTTTEVRERPILFSGPMVRAILAGQKTQTRRVMKPQPPEDAGRLDVGTYHPCIEVGGFTEPGDETFGAWTWDGEWAARCPFGRPGERLWVREAIRCFDWLDGGETSVEYAADCALHPDAEWVWERNSLPSMFCPRGLSRITLDITGVRVERVQGITDTDSESEGAMHAADETTKQDAARRCAAEGRAACTVRDYFRERWDALNARRGFGWDANPWVWVIEFRPVAALDAEARRA